MDVGREVDPGHPVPPPRPRSPRGGSARRLSSSTMNSVPRSPNETGSPPSDRMRASTSLMVVTTGSRMAGAKSFTAMTIPETSTGTTTTVPFAAIHEAEVPGRKDSTNTSKVTECAPADTTLHRKETISPTSTGWIISTLTLAVTARGARNWNSMVTTAARSTWDVIQPPKITLGSLPPASPVIGNALIAKNQFSIMHSSSYAATTYSDESSPSSNSSDTSSRTDPSTPVGSQPHASKASRAKSDERDLSLPIAIAAAYLGQFSTIYPYQDVGRFRIPPHRWAVSWPYHAASDGEGWVWACRATSLAREMDACVITVLASCVAEVVDPLACLATRLVVDGFVSQPRRY